MPYIDIYCIGLETYFVMTHGRNILFRFPTHCLDKRFRPVTLLGLNYSIQTY